LYNSLIAFGMLMTSVRLIKMCLNENYSRVRVGKHLSDMLPIKTGLKQDALLSLFFNFPLENAIRSVQINQKCLKLNGINQLLAYVVDVKVCVGSIHNIKENTQA